MKNLCLAAASLALLAFNGNAAAEPDDYRPPAGLNGHSWGEAFGATKGLSLWRANLALNSMGKQAEVWRERREGLPDVIQQRVDGDGSYGVGEYYFQYDRNPFHSSKVDVQIISYIYCVRFMGDYPPSKKSMAQKLKLCGSRVTFKSEPASDGNSAFDRVLRQLIEQHGPPPGFERSPTVTVESEDQTVTSPRKQQKGIKGDFVRYRWCGPDEDAKQLYPSCSATVTLAMDEVTGEGTVLYATAPLYGYAYARHTQGDENNELYALLSGRPIFKPYGREKMECTSTHICMPRKGGMSKSEVTAFQP